MLCVFGVFLTFVAVLKYYLFILFLTVQHKKNILINLHWDNKHSDSDSLLSVILSVPPASTSDTPLTHLSTQIEELSAQIEELLLTNQTYPVWRGYVPKPQNLFFLLIFSCFPFSNTLLTDTIWLKNFLKI